jgi:hypothetical protein
MEDTRYDDNRLFLGLRSPSAKELKAKQKKQITDNIKKDRFKYASR